MKKTFSGFSLVELLVVTILISAVLSVGIAQYTKFNRIQTLGKVYEGLKSDLRYARSKAINGEVPDACSSDEPLAQYGVNFTGTSSYLINASCEGGATVTIKSVNLPAGITLEIPGQNPIYFKVLGRGTNVSGSVDIVIANSESSQVVTVTNTGEIK